jgi:hypothetical protein
VIQALSETATRRTRLIVDEEPGPADLLRSLGLPVDAIATSGEWGVIKPDAAFFDRVAEFVPCDRTETVYVGDHRDNDVVPSHKAGFRTALIRRGPWCYLWADDPLVRETADWVVDALPELVELLAPTGRGRRSISSAPARPAKPSVFLVGRNTPKRV